MTHSLSEMSILLWMLVLVAVGRCASVGAVDGLMAVGVGMGDVGGASGFFDFSDVLGVLWPSDGVEASGMRELVRVTVGFGDRPRLRLRCCFW